MVGGFLVPTRVGMCMTSVLKVGGCCWLHPMDLAL